MRKFIDSYYRLLNVLLGASVAALIVPVTIQMISRNTGLIPAWIWTEEMARFLFIWMVMLGAMIGVRDGSHFECDVWPELQAARQCVAAHRLDGVRPRRSRWCSSGTGSSSCNSAGTRPPSFADMPMTYIFISWPLTGSTVVAVRLRAAPGVPAHGHRRPRPGSDLPAHREIGTGSVV